MVTELFLLSPNFKGGISVTIFLRDFLFFLQFWNSQLIINSRDLEYKNLFKISSKIYSASNRKERVTGINIEVEELS